MIKRNLNSDLQGIHRHDAVRHAFIYPEKRTTISIPIVPKKTAGIENMKLAAALSLVYTACHCLTIHYHGTSENQKKKAQIIKDMAWFQMRKVAKTLHEFDVMQIGARIDTINTRLGFKNQPSWMVYLSFCIAVMNDAFPTLKSTRLSDRKTDLESVLKALQSLHDYMTKKEGKQAELYDKKACELYTMWEGLF